MSTVLTAQLIPHYSLSMKNWIFVLPLTLSLIGCASTRLKPEAAHVVVSDAPAAKGCRLVGEVEAHTKVNVANTSNSALTNIIKNDAHELGGNYVQLSQNTNLRMSGQVYNCQ